jgi:uncharacterized repeat protein (TIGR02543 family)
MRKIVLTIVTLTLLCGCGDMWDELFGRKIVIFDKNNADSGSTEANPQGMYVHPREGRVGSLPAPPTRPGYAFAGWNVEADGSGKAFSGNTRVSQTMPVYAQWERNDEGIDHAITLSAIIGVSAPTVGGTPVAAITETEQYSGTVTWLPEVSETFAEATEYTATISLAVKTGYTLKEVAENFFTVAGATTTNAANSGLVTAVFQKTGFTSLLGIELVSVPGGSFQMGSNDSLDWGASPPHTVTLTGFYMGKYPVTQAQYELVMGSNPSYFTAENGNPPVAGEEDAMRPVEQVSWYDAIVFCNRLSMAAGLTPAYSILGSTNSADWGAVPTSSNTTWNKAEMVSGANGYRLPTEAQWEYAAKGGNGSPSSYTYSGSNDINAVAWYWDNSGEKTHEVGKKAANGLGLYNMSGNVLEWCWDWYDSYSNASQTDPVGPVRGADREFRGGCWLDSAEFVRSAKRNGGNPGFRGINFFGFRLLRP